MQNRKETGALLLARSQFAPDHPASLGTFWLPTKSKTRKVWHSPGHFSAVGANDVHVQLLQLDIQCLQFWCMHERANGYGGAGGSVLQSQKDDVETTCTKAGCFSGSRVSWPDLTSCIRSQVPRESGGTSMPGTGQFGRSGFDPTRLHRTFLLTSPLGSRKQLTSLFSHIFPYLSSGQPFWQVP